MPPIKGYATKDNTHQKVTQLMMTPLDVTYFSVLQGLLTNIFLCPKEEKKQQKIL